MTIGITGASGHIGNVVCRKLLSAGHTVKAMYHKDSSSLKGLDVKQVVGDILNKEAVMKLTEGCDVVIHAAAIISIDGDPDGMVFKTNTEGPKMVLEACLNMGVKKLLHISSVHAVTELPHDQPYDETRPYKTAQDSAYDFSKSTGEQIVLNGSRGSALEVVVLRPSCVIGPYDFKPSKMGAALMDFKHRKIPFLPEGGYDLADIRDVADSIISAIEKGRNGEAYLLSGNYYSMRTLSHIIQQTTGIPTPKMVIPYKWLVALLPLVMLVSRIRKSAPSYTRESLEALKNGHPRMNNRKAQKELGHQTRPLAETLRDFYEWQKQNGRS